MKACNCTLLYTNPNACKNCPNNTWDEEVGTNWYPYPYEPYTNWYPYPYEPYTAPLQPNTVKVKRTVKTIEKYGPNGEYLGKEVITEEKDEYDKMVYSGSIPITSGEGTYISTDSVNWDPNDPNVQWSYTNNANTEDVQFCVN